VHRFNHFGAVDALEIDRGDAKVRVTELALDHVQPDALACQFDCVRMAELVGSESASYSGAGGCCAELGACGGRSPVAAARRSVDGGRPM
jgi:hypothetical protein